MSRPSADAPRRATSVISIEPRQGATSHLVVLLHGVGASAESFQEVARVLASGLPSAEFLVPDGFHPFDGGGDGRQWFSVRGVTEENRAARVREAGAEVSRWIDGELASRGLGGDRLAVIGFSQGAILAAWLALHRAPRPAAAVMLSGRVAEDQPAERGATAPEVFIGHGERDPMMPVAQVAQSTRVLQAWGARVTARTYPGLGHHLDARELGDVAEFLKRVLEQP